MAFESGVMPEDWRSAVIVFHCTRVKKEGRLLSVVGKIYAGILVDEVRKVTKGLIDDGQGGFEEWIGCVDPIFTLK